jgi:hypothetical protein
MQLCRVPDQKFGEINVVTLFDLRKGLTGEAAVIAFDRLCSRGGAPGAAVLFDSAVSAQPNGSAFKERVPALVLEGGGIRRKLVASEPLADVLFLHAAQAVAPGCIESCRKVCIKFERNCSYTTLYSTHA